MKDADIIDFVAQRSQRRVPSQVYFRDAEVCRVNEFLALCGICGSRNHRASHCPMRPGPTSPHNGD